MTLLPFLETLVRILNRLPLFKIMLGLPRAIVVDESTAPTSSNVETNLTESIHIEKENVILPESVLIEKEDVVGLTIMR